MSFATIYKVHRFPAIPMGGPFLIVVGLAIVAGGLRPQALGLLVNLGLIVGGLTFTVSWKLARSLPDMTRLQVTSVVVAIVVEAAVLVASNKAISALDERGQLLALLAIVAAHFLLMLPAYGLAALALTTFCGVNVAIGWSLPAYPVHAVWAVDGVIKLAIGITMAVSSPACSSQRAGAG